jgi:hypothetical protein
VKDGDIKRIFPVRFQQVLPLNFDEKSVKFPRIFFTAQQSSLNKHSLS